MAYNKDLVGRLRKALKGRKQVSEREMFGGIAFMHEGRIFVGVIKDDLMVRVGKENYQSALTRAHVRPMEFTGKPMKGYVYVSPEGVVSDEEIKMWIDIAIDFVETLPKK